MQAIVYVSNTGFTQKYAELLAKRTELPVLSLEQAKGKLPEGAQILYLGWVQAGKIVGYAGAAKRYSVQALCAVGMMPTESLDLCKIRAGNRVPQGCATFYLRGGIDKTKLRGLAKGLIAIMSRVIEKKQEKSTDEASMAQMLKNGADFVREEQLAPVLAWYNERE